MENLMLKCHGDFERFLVMHQIISLIYIYISTLLGSKLSQINLPKCMVSIKLASAFFGLVSYNDTCQMLGSFPFEAPIKNC